MTIEQGRRFSHVYLARGEPTADSQRMRLRVYRLFNVIELDKHISRDEVELALGVPVTKNINGGTRWEKFFLECDLRDFLDLITVVYSGTADRQLRCASTWIEGVSTIFREENVRYRVDECGGVHFAIDSEFEHNQACAVTALQGARFGAARSHFDAAQRALDANPPATREAIRQTFDCAETIFKLMFPDVTRLGSAEATKKLKPLLDAMSEGTERDNLGRMLESLKEWINGAHPFRHGQSVEEPDNPSIASTVLSVSVGSAFIRWLAELDSRVRKGAEASKGLAVEAAEETDEQIRP